MGARWPRWVAACALVATTMSPALAAADEPPASASSYCRQVRARGDSDAALLVWPKVVVQGIRFPNSGADLTLAGGQQYQGRVGLDYSPVDLVKGLGVKDVAKADCAQHEVQASLEQLLAHADDAGKLPALRLEAAYLDGRRSEWQALVTKEEERFEARVVSLVEYDDVRTRAAELERKAVQVHGETDRLAARGVERPEASLAALESRYLARADAYEREVSHVRSIAAWDLKVRGGVVATEQPVDWYGLVELSFNLGAFEHHAADNRYLEARRDERAHAHYEMASRLHDFAAELAGIRAQAHRELEVLDRQVTFLTSTRRALGGSEAPGTAHALAALTLDQISLESDQTYLRALIVELTAILDDHAG
jgi:hypothetical protein